MKPSQEDMEPGNSAGIDHVHELRGTRGHTVQNRTAISAVFFLNGFGLASWLIHIPSVKGQLGLDEQQLGLALLGIGLGSLLTMWLSGWLMGRFGSRRVLTVATLCFALSLVFPVWAPNFLLLTTSLGFMGGCNGLMDVCMNNQAAHFEALAGRPVMSSFHAIWSLGGWCGSLLGSLFLLHQQLATWHLVILCLLIVGGMVRLAPNLLPTVSEHGPIFALPTREILIFALLCLIAMLSEGAVADWAGVHLRDDLGAPYALSGLGFNAFAICMAGGRFIGDRIVQQIGRERTVTAGALLGAIGLFVAALASAPILSIMGFGLAGLGMSNVVPVLFSLAALRIPGAIERATSSVFATGYLGFLIGPPLVGMFAQRFTLPVALAGVGILVAGICVLGPRRRAVRGER
jgi:MFS family permease